LGAGGTTGAFGDVFLPEKKSAGRVAGASVEAGAGCPFFFVKKSAGSVAGA